MTEITHCYLCGTPLNLHQETRDFFKSNKPFQLKKCPACNLLHTSPLPAEEEAGYYYDSPDYLSHQSNSKNPLTLIYKYVRRIALRQKFTLISHLSPEQSVLDYGCGTGHFLAYCKKRSWHVQGLEPNSNARHTAENLLNQPVSPSINEITGTYGIITLWHVLEHLYDPLTVLSYLKANLHSKGKFIIAVPNYQSPDAVHYQSYWAAYDVPRHVHHFDKSSLQKLATHLGMNIEQILPMKFDAYYVSLLSEKYKHPSSFPYLRAIKQGLISNNKAAKTMNYSSLIYVIQ